MSVLVVAALAAVSIQAPEVPSSIHKARIEVRSGTTPAAALAEVARRKGESWVGWSVAAVPDSGEVCCFNQDFERSGCSLADPRDSWGTHGDDRAQDTGTLYVLVGVEAGAPSRMRIVSPTCQVQGADRRLIWLGPVEAGESLAALDELLDARREGLSESALAAIAYHADARADAAIARRALDRSASQEDRQHAMFWAALARGPSGYRLVERILSSDPSGEIREHAVFALGQSRLPEAPERIKRVSLEDRDAEVRGEALFWLAQTQAPGAGDWIVSRLDADPDPHVREQAVFALSQLEDGTDRLLEVLRSKRDAETVRRALFWLGQSEDPRALAEIEKIVER